MINGNEYASEDVKIILPGKPIPEEGVVAIEYDVMRDHKEIYGMGKDPVRLGRGKKERKAAVTVLQSVLEGMQAILLPGQDLTDLPPFPITVAYAPAGGLLTVDHLLFVRVKSYTKQMKSGDDHMEIKMELAVGDIKYNV